MHTSHQRYTSVVQDRSDEMLKGMQAASDLRHASNLALSLFQLQPKSFERHRFRCKDF
jgi:hypothetical protein